MNLPDPLATPQQALVASELRYRRLFETARDGILILDAETGQIVDANPFVLKLIGYAHEEVVGHTVGDVSPFKDIEANASMLEQLKESGYVRYEHLPLKARDGRSISVEFVSNSYMAGSQRVIQCNIRDITERKQAERKIQQLTDELTELNRTLEARVEERTSELQAANEALEAFSHTVSHDLQAPLRQITGFIALMSKGSAPTASAVSQEHLGMIAGAAKRMGQLIDDLLAFSRIDRVAMDVVEVNLDSLVQDVVREQVAATPDRDILWRVRALPRVHADRALLRQVFVNLIANAVKFTRGKEPAQIEISQMPGERAESVIFVRDNGAGFDSRYAHKLFGVFQRLHSQTEFPGTGIGLANVHRIIARHNGHAWAEGALGHGATFFVSLPHGGPLPTPPLRGGLARRTPKGGDLATPPSEGQRGSAGAGTSGSDA